MRKTKFIEVPAATVMVTVSHMKRLALQGREDPSVRLAVEQATKGLVPGDYASEVLAIFYYVTANVRYLRDMHGIEYLQEPRHLLKSKAGDCDDMATLIASMLMAAGNRARFAVVGFKKGTLSHVLTQVLVPGTGWVTLDPVPRRKAQQMMGDIKEAEFVNL